MIQKIYTGCDAMTLRVSVTTDGEQDIRLIVRDSEMPTAVLTDRVKTINGKHDFFVRMPICRNFVDVILVNDSDSTDNGFVYNGFKKFHLERRMTDIDFTAYHLFEYITFIQKFCYNAAVLPTNDPANERSFYHSNGKRFWIKYLDVIVDEDGQEVATPARIAQDGSFIEVSKKYFAEYTVPMGVAVLLHEYAHPYINVDPSDETEADLNGLFIYLALGYPRFEGGMAWCEVFENYPTEQNANRIAIIDKFIEDFDKGKMVIF